MKKILLITTLLCSAGLFGMQPLEKVDYKVRLVYVKKQLLAETRQGGPTLDSLVAHADGMTTIKNQIDRDVPTDEKTALIKKWDTTLRYLARRFNHQAGIQPHEVAEWLIIRLNELDNDADDYEVVDESGKTAIRNSYTVLNIIAQEVNEALPDQRDQINRLLSNISDHIFGEVAQQYV